MDVTTDGSVNDRMEGSSVESPPSFIRTVDAGSGSVDLNDGGVEVLSELSFGPL